jgi:purine catabolism regulator
MTTTVRETLTLDSFKGFRVLAGQSGLDRAVSTTTFIEAPDSWKWIRGGEFVLTLGYAFQEESQLFDLVHKLIDHGASCIGIKTERFLKRIPENVLELAEQHSFPVIDIPISVPFAEIIHPVQSLVINDQARLLKYSERVRHAFFALSVKAAEIEEIIQTLWEFIHLDLIFLEASTGKKYLTSDSSHLLAVLDDKPLKDVLAEYPHEDVTLNGRLMGYLIFDTEPEKLGEHWAEIPLNQAKGALLLYFQRLEAKKQVESRYRNEFVQDLISRNIRMEQEAWNRAKVFNWSLEGPQRVVVVDIDNYKSTLTSSISRGQGASAVENIKSRIYSIARSLLGHLDGGKYPYAEMSDSIVFIFPGGTRGRDAFYPKLLDALDSMMKAIREETGFTVTVGIGEPRDSVFDCSESYREACQGLELLRASCGGNKIAPWEEMGVFKLLSSISGTPESEQFVARWLGPLPASGRQGEQNLLETLKTLQQCGFNLKEASPLLAIHYNTLKYRWKKICDVLNIDPANSNDLLNVSLALKLHQLRDGSLMKD